MVEEVCMCMCVLLGRGVNYGTHLQFTKKLFKKFHSRAAAAAVAAIMTTTCATKRRTKSNSVVQFLKKL